MTRTTLGLFGVRRQAATPATRAPADCMAGLTPIERSAAEAIMRQGGDRRRG
ncbi:hypothetical protein SAMN05192583_2964 [Sphingomonas gellani]|uniref:Uncharacterized protein n=1 Tax=Sphingomonas gellani TaxID=1166340 RepID=A0A1H8H8P7_9SPHN|nr:hypothetical protein [Sphingomonas gellani]SEN52430.1 hypothetical protein SAMN05192583_2964 [Sphingomonas gellani]